MRRAATTGALALALAVGVAGPSAAADYTHTDPAKDVVLTDPFDVGPAPDNKEADIVKVSVTHSATKVRSTIELRDITKSRKHNFVINLRAKVGAKVRHFDIYLQTDPSDAQGELTVYGKDGLPVTCPGQSSDIDYGKDVVTVTVPRSCLGKPSWVKTAITAEWVPSHDDYYSDNGLKKGGAPGVVTYSPQITKG